MFSKLISRCSTLLTKNKYQFGPKKTLKQRMRENLTPETIQKRKQQSHLQIGLYGFVVACCFAAIPLYRTFCEHVGLVGNTDKKAYDFKDKQSSLFLTQLSTLKNLLLNLRVKLNQVSTGSLNLWKKKLLWEPHKLLLYSIGCATKKIGLLSDFQLTTQHRKK